MNAVCHESRLVHPSGFAKENLSLLRSALSGCHATLRDIPRDALGRGRVGRHVLICRYQKLIAGKSRHNIIQL